MVCAADHLAAGAGVAMLRDGGSAADAAVAAGAVLAVTTQHMCGMGGDLFALVHSPDGEAPVALCAAGRAGSGADPAALRAEGRSTMPFTGDIRSVTVPGCVDGWLALHGRFGRLPLAAVLAPARSYAADGFPASPLLAASIGAVAGLPGAEDFTARSPGATVRRPGVAAALDAVAGGGRDAFYLGDFGRGLLELGAGEYTEEDLRRPQAEWATPLHLDAWGRRLWTAPPPSQGYLTLASAWIAAGLPLPADPGDPAWAHLTVEAARQAGFDRPAVLHDGADGAALLIPERLGPRRDAIDPERPAALGDTYAGGGTIHLCAVDEERMGVSLTQSNANGWGAHIVEPTTRIFLHNRGIGFSLAPGHPAEYGPGRRPPHTLSPALVTADGRLDTVLGTRGGDSQPQVILPLLARLRAAGQSPAAAVAAGRWRLTSPTPPGTTFDTWDAGGRVRVEVEGHAPPGWGDSLRAMGHDVSMAAPYDHGFGHAHVVRVDGGHLAGASDPRARTGAAAAW